LPINANAAHPAKKTRIEKKARIGQGLMQLHLRSCKTCIKHGSHHLQMKLRKAGTRIPLHVNKIAQDSSAVLILSAEKNYQRPTHPRN